MNYTIIGKISIPRMKKEEGNMLNIVIAIVSMFFFCKAIDIVSFVLNSRQNLDIKLDLDTGFKLVSICKLLLVINSSVNPIIYEIFSKKYRNILFCIIKCGKKTYVCMSIFRFQQL